MSRQKVIYIRTKAAAKLMYFYAPEEVRPKVVFAKRFSKKQRKEMRSRLFVMQLLNLVRNKELARELFAVQYLEGPHSHPQLDLSS